MAELDISQLLFLASQGVSIEDTFDAEGLDTWFYKELMSGSDFLIAYGVTPCDRGGHTLRSRNGTCVQCDRSQLAYIKRWKADGYIYVAYSEEIPATKVGVGVNPEARIKKLKLDGYGGARDWNLFKSMPCASMGLMEHRVHAQLSACRAYASYVRNGKHVDCKELFTKSPKAVWRVVTRTLKGTA